MVHRHHEALEQILRQEQVGALAGDIAQRRQGSRSETRLVLVAFLLRDASGYYGGRELAMANIITATTNRLVVEDIVDYDVRRLLLLGSATANTGCGTVDVGPTIAVETMRRIVHIAACSCERPLAQRCAVRVTSLPSRDGAELTGGDRRRKSGVDCFLHATVVCFCAVLFLEGDTKC